MRKVRDMWEIQSCQKDDESYPKILRDIKTAPDILYYVGDISVCENNVIAVVGKRDAAERYLKIAKRIGEILAREGFTVLNGLAVGVDAYASEGAVEANGKVVAVQAGGCLISEYPNGTRPQKYTFVQRDRIQAMLSNKVFIVDAEKDGGTMHTADYATKYAKPLGCFVESAGMESPAGNRLLVDSCRASAVQDTEELINFAGQPDYAQISLFV